MHRNIYYTLFAILMTALMSVSITSCGSEDLASDIDGSQSKFTYTIGNQTYTYSKYWQSIIGPESLDLIHDGKKVYWSMELWGAIDDAADGNWLNFNIFSNNVEKGFELTKDNFCVPYWPLGDTSSKTFHFHKKSGSAKLTEFGTHSAKMVFNNFVMEADGASFNIMVNGTVDLEVD